MQPLPAHLESRLSGQQLRARPLKVFGVEYLHLETPEKGDLYVTRFGRGWIEHLLPENWNDLAYYQRSENAQYRLPLRGSGRPYKITTKPVDGRRLELVVKRCRVGQDVQVSKTCSASFVPDSEIMNARWNGPFEEFGLLMELRAANRYLPRKLRTQMPLAIYAPPEREPLWRTGREPYRMYLPNLLMQRDQEGVASSDAIELDIQRQYIMLYQWVKGVEASVVFERFGMADQLEAFTRRVYEDDLLLRGYSVPDTKPDHIIVRVHKNRMLRDRSGEIVFALVDFELLHRTHDYQLKYQMNQRRRYWALHMRENRKDKALPGGRYRVNIFGVDYVYGKTSNNGRLWVVGNEPDLFDYYEPMRWRKTPRIQLSGIAYRTTSLDDVQLVYRRSRMGIKPQESPFSPVGSRISEYGYNSPFEEVAIAKQLKALGFETVYPRAIYRTAHESLPAEYLLDDSRYRSHAGYLMPDGMPLLTNCYDYYTVWGMWRGIDPYLDYRSGGHWGMVDVDHAYCFGLLSKEEYEALVIRTIRRLQAVGLSETYRTERFLLRFNNGELARTPSGDFLLTVAIDGYRAFQSHLLSQEDYANLMRTERRRLEEHGFVPLDFRGDHLLLSIDPDGVFERARDGRIRTVLCNFELMLPPEPLIGENIAGEANVVSGSPAVEAGADDAQPVGAQGNSTRKEN